MKANLPLRAPASSRWKDCGEGGVLLGGLLVWVIVGLAALFGISVLAAVDFKFLLALMMIVVIGLAVVGSVLYRMDFKYVIIIAVICLAITFVVTVTPTAVVGLLLVGFAMWKLTPEKHLALMVAMIGVGLLLVLWGSRGLMALGVFP